MIKKAIMATMVVLVTLISMVGMTTATATGDILIHPDTDIIDVSVDPNAVSPPLGAEFIGWGTSGSTTYNVIVRRTSDNFVPTDCSVSGTLTISDPQTITLPACKIPASDVGVAYHVYASAKCPAGGCQGTSRSRDLTVDAPITPTPELGTYILTTAGLIGLVGLVRCRRKD